MNSKRAIVRPWPRLLDLNSAADYSGVSRTVVKEWWSTGQIQAFELPGIRGRKKLDKIVFERRELDRFLGLKPE